MKRSLIVVALLLQGCSTASLCNPAPAAAAAPNPADPCNPEAVAYGAPAPQSTNVYAPPCGPTPQGYRAYESPSCNPWMRLGTQLGEARLPGQDCPMPSSMAFVPEAPAACAPAAPYVVPAAPPCAPAVAVAAAPQPNCGPLPTEAKLGEVWCCVYVQPPAAAPQSVCTKEACRVAIPVPARYETRSETYCLEQGRVEWQNVACSSTDAKECWKLVQVPAKMASRQYDVCVEPASTRYEEIPAVYEMRASAPPPGYWQWQRTPSCEVPAPPASPPPAGVVSSIVVTGSPDAGHACGAGGKACGNGK